MIVQPHQFPRFLLILICLCLLAMLLALGIGRFSIPAADIWTMLSSKLTSVTVAGEASANADVVLFELRLPRVLAAFLVGASLAIAGAAFQVLFRNPLVSPDILGVTSGAALGAIVGILLGASALLIQFSAFAGGITVVALVLALQIKLSARSAVRDSTLTLVLLGIVIGAFFATLLSLIKYLADPYSQLPAITYWLLGSMAGVRSADIWLLLAICITAAIPLYLLRWRMDVLSLGDEEAQTLGINATKLRYIVIIAATLLTAVSVALVGSIGWVGLVVPHVARLLTGATYARLMPVAALLGGLLMVVVDTVARSMAAVEIPPGIITALVGAPMFIWLLATSFARGRNAC
jgi:iron complex transport system permease protein